MRMMAALIVVAVLLAFFEGDQGDHPPRKPPGTFKVRLETALTTKDFTTRDRLLKDVALEAAAGGDSEAVTQAIAGILARETKDAVASESALRLAAVGVPEAANKIAAMIIEPNLRKLTLEKIGDL